jgi:hypothetical protein
MDGAQDPAPAPGVPPVPDAPPMTRRQMRELRELDDEVDEPAEHTDDEHPEPSAVPEATVAAETPAKPAAPYAPPPKGASYLAPKPPGVPFTSPPENARPLADFGMPAMTPLAPSPRIESVDSPKPTFVDAPVTPSVSSVPQPAAATSAPTIHPTGPTSSTVAAWLIGALPLLQFIVIYLVFGPLDQPFPAGSQWGVLASPIVLSLIFAILDRRILTSRGYTGMPSVVFALIPPLYLVMRCVRFGLSALAPLIAWFVLQVAAAIGYGILLPTVVAGVLGTG